MNYHKGMPRSYPEARSLHVIDRQVARLVDVMNCEPLIFTTGSCQGHGHLFIKVPPYVAFKTNIDIASALAKILHDDYHSLSFQKLNYYWEVTACFDSNFELTYMLSIPGISSDKWFFATKRGVNQDFESIGLMVQKILDHFKSKNIEMKRDKNSAKKNDQCNCNLHL